MTYPPPPPPPPESGGFPTTPYGGYPPPSDGGGFPPPPPGQDPAWGGGPQGYPAGQGPSYGGPPPKRSPNPALIVVLAAALVGVLIVAVVVASGGDDDPDSGGGETAAPGGSTSSESDAAGGAEIDAFASWVADMIDAQDTDNLSAAACTDASESVEDAINAVSQTDGAELTGTEEVGPGEYIVTIDISVGGSPTPFEMTVVEGGADSLCVQDISGF